MLYLKSFFACFTISDYKVADCGTDRCSCTTTTTRFSWQHIKKQTNNFSTLIGTGGFSTVFLARLPEYSGLTAVKVQSAFTDRLARMHDQELQILLRLKHPNIVKFLGHSSSCDDQEDQRALLFEYAPNGTLYDKLLLLHGSSDHVTALTWKTRVLIAFQLATALEYLHGIQIIHGDIKSSNILLDQQLNCKLCDFGSAKLGFTSMVLRPPSSNRLMIMGSQGYVDPHYLKTGLVSKKNDVYSFGVVLLELITGREAFRMERAVGEKKLTEIVAPVLNGAAVGVEEVVDPRLRYTGDDGGFDLEEVKAMLSVAEKCIGCSLMVRPSASQIVASMRENIPSIIHFVKNN